MMIAIHHRDGSFSNRWITYCHNNSIPYKVVNCYDIDIIEQLKDCDILLWHHHHNSYKDALFAKQLLFSVKKMGKKVFPDFDTNWHFDDKVGQKYLLEAINAPIIPTYVFFDKSTALSWAQETTFPKVFKLRGGAGSKNVRLVKSKSEAIKKINKAFNKGFSQFDAWENFKERYRKYKNGNDSLVGMIKGLGRFFIPTRFSVMRGREKGYIYFQEFIPHNSYDIRVIVIGNRAFAIKRGVREGDFRASGSGNISYNKDEINLEAIKISFEVNKRLSTQSVAFDFVKHNNKLLIVEISYCFTAEPYDLCPGYWDNNLNWFEGQFNAQEWMIQNIISQ